MCDEVLTKVQQEVKQEEVKQDVEEEKQEVEEVKQEVEVEEARSMPRRPLGLTMKQIRFRLCKYRARLVVQRLVGVPIPDDPEDIVDTIVDTLDETFPEHRWVAGLDHE